MSKKRTDEELKIDMGAGAFMFQARDLGPVRFGVTGRKHNTTHWHTPSKAEYFLLPVESNSEMSTMFLLDISISVTKYMAQPHRLEFSSTSWMRRQIYTPDIQATVPYWFVEILRSGVPFAAAALGLPPARAVRDPLVLEVKKDQDAEKPDYTRKLAEARVIYERNGFHFFVIESSPDLTFLDCAHLPSILLDEDSVIPEDSLTLAWHHLLETGGATNYAAMMEVLGGEPVGREATNVLHMQRAIWVDFSRNPVGLEGSTRVVMPPLLAWTGPNPGLLLRGLR